MAAHATKTKPAPARQPADLIAEWAPWVKTNFPFVELDFSFSQNAITICDMRVPNALRYGVLYKKDETEMGEHKKPGDLERRIREFMR